MEDKKMTNSEILLLCLDKVDDKLDKNIIKTWRMVIPRIMEYKTVNGVPDIAIDDAYRLIFSHEFARAFWGNKKVTKLEYVDLDSDDNSVIENDYYLWQYHLQQMVISENPIQYLKQFIKEDED